MKNFKDIKKPFIIAEIGGNHEGSFYLAKKLVMEAIWSGVGAVKLQRYRADKLVNKSIDPVRNKHFKDFELSIGQYEQLAELVQQAGLVFMSSLWDKESVDELDKYIPIHKVGSGDLTNYPLLKALALKDKPLILSTAMADVREISESLRFIHNINPNLMNENKLAVMHCVAMYENPMNKYANLNSINKLKDDFPYIEVGYSDHTVGSTACEMALAMGCKIIEKHFTLESLADNDFRDHIISLQPYKMEELVRKASKVSSLLGDYDCKPVKEIETANSITQFRRAVYPKIPIAKGTVVEEKHLTTLRPNIGIDARDYYSIIGTTATRDIPALNILRESDFE